MEEYFMSLEKRPAKLILAGTCGVRMKTVEISRAARGIHDSIKAGKVSASSTPCVVA